MNSIFKIKTPKSCSECELEHDVDGYKGFCIPGSIYLGGLGVAKEYKTSRHPQCPLIPLPDKLEVLQNLELLYDIVENSRVNQFKKGFAKGYKEDLQDFINTIYGDSNE